MAGPGRPASPRAPVAAETDRPDPPRDGPPRWAGRGSSLPGAPGLGLGGPDSSWAALRSVCFALGPAPEVGTGPDCGLEVAGGRTWVRALGCFLNEVLSASHSGGGDPPAAVVRVDGERRARVRSPPPPPQPHPVGSGGRGVSRHTCCYFFKVSMGSETGMDRTLLPRVAGEGALDPSACPRGSRSSDVTLSHPSPTP